MPSVCFGGKKNLKNGDLETFRYRIQRINEMKNCIGPTIEIMEQCKSKKKSLVVEDLNFKQLKTRMLYRPKTQNKNIIKFCV